MALELNGTTGVSLVQDGVVTAADLASGAITTAALPAGSVLQVVNAEYFTEVNSASSTLADTGLTATITPSSASSKILILINQNGLAKYGGTTTDTRMEIGLLRNGTVIKYLEARAAYNNSTQYNWVAGTGMNYLDSPNTTSAVTYKTQFRRANGDGSVRVQDAGATDTSSTITLMEIAA